MTGYYKSGKIKRKDYYENDSLISGNIYTESGNDTNYVPFKIDAKFLGASDFNDFIKHNIKYPIEAFEKGIEGIVVVQFMIDTLGFVSRPKVKFSANSMLNDAAIAVVKKSPRWKPALLDGAKTEQQMQISISFYLKDDVIPNE